MQLHHSAFLIIGAVAFCSQLVQCDNVDTYHATSEVDFSTEANPNSMLCLNIKPQHTVNIKQILGVWYGSEIIMHSQDVPGVFQYDSCVVIHLSDVTAQMQMASARDYGYSNNNNNYRRKSTVAQYSPQQSANNDDLSPAGTKYLRLVWNEKDDNLEYTFNYTEYGPGLWTNVGEQRGSLVSLNQYTQFSGSVQVVKAVNDHLVLMFCGKDVRSSIYSIVLSRKPLALSAEDLRGIRNLLSRRGLYTETIRKVCASAAAGLQHSTLLLPLLLLPLLWGVFTTLRKGR